MCAFVSVCLSVFLFVCACVCVCDKPYTHVVFDPYLISKNAPGKAAALTGMNKFKSSLRPRTGRDTVN